jgi:hypothetical protein
MPKFFLFLGCWFITSSNVCQSPPAVFPDVPIITETSVGKVRLGMPVVQLKELYKGCTFVPTHMIQYGFDDTSNKRGGVTVSSKGRKLFLYFMDWQTKKKVAGILAFHPAYRTAKGIHAGSTSGELKAAQSSVQVVPNMMLPVFQIAFIGEVGEPGIEYIFYQQKELGKYVVADEPVKIAVTDAKISWIQVRANQ